MKRLEGMAVFITSDEAGDITVQTDNVGGGNWKN